MAKKRKYAPRDPKGLTGAVVVWLWILVAIYAVDVGVLGLWLWKLWPLDPALDVAAQPSEPVALAALLVVATQMLTLVILLISAIVSGKWIYRTDANAHVLARGLTVSPLWSVGFFFVPFLCLVRPYEALREIWQVSTKPKGWRAVREPALLRWWWGLFLVGNLAGYLASVLDRGHTAGEMRVGYSTLLGADLMQLAVNLLFMAIVVRVGARQVEALRAHAASTEEEPAPGWLP